jgi:hypothetical protein
MKQPVATVTVGVHFSQVREVTRHRNFGSTPYGAAALFIFLFIFRRPKDVGVLRISDGMGGRSEILCDFGNCRRMN